MQSYDDPTVSSANTHGGCHLVIITLQLCINRPDIAGHLMHCYHKNLKHYVRNWNSAKTQTVFRTFTPYTLCVKSSLLYTTTAKQINNKQQTKRQYYSITVYRQSLHAAVSAVEIATGITPALAADTDINTELDIVLPPSNATHISLLTLPQETTPVHNIT